MILEISLESSGFNLFISNTFTIFFKFKAAVVIRNCISTFKSPLSLDLSISDLTGTVFNTSGWIRNHEMTCWQVWINEDNNFQFIFWYLYADNNWVRIYDMEDNLVYEVDLPDPNLIVDLHDGFYMAKTFHHDTLLQEFLIGKP